MADSPLRVMYLTAGGAGMFCGSCMHDNTLVSALLKQGLDIQLLPLYTPIRTDEENVSVDRVFFGGVNVYLQQKIPLFRHLPMLVDRFLDQPWLLRLATRLHSVETSPHELGGLTVSMLRGVSGFQRKEVTRLCAWLRREQPNLICLSNMLIAGSAPMLKQEVGAPILATLQGDDIFLDGLTEPYRTQAFQEIHKLIDSIDGFIVNSHYYADYMSEYFGIAREKIHVLPLGIDTTEFAQAAPAPSLANPPTVGYLARLVHEKGLHVLVEAFIELRRRPQMEQARLHIAGWVGDDPEGYAEEQFQKLHDAGLADAFEYRDLFERHQDKVDFLRELDVLSTPTTYREPKGLFVLEALAAGVPVVQPDHGAFPELLADTGGGRLVRPNDPAHLADVLHELLLDHEARKKLAEHGRRAVLESRNVERTSTRVLQLYHQMAQR